MTETNKNIQTQNNTSNSQNITKNRININKDSFIQRRKQQWNNKSKECKEFMLKYGRKGMMINNGINFAIFGLTFLGVKKINLFKNQHRGLRIVANVAIAAGIYQALWYPRNALTNQAVPFIMEKLDIKVSQEEKKKIEERFKALENGQGPCGPLGAFWGKWSQCEKPNETKNNKNQMLLSEVGINKNQEVVSKKQNDVQK